MSAAPPPSRPRRCSTATACCASAPTGWPCRPSRPGSPPCCCNRMDAVVPRADLLDAGWPTGVPGERAGRQHPRRPHQAAAPPADQGRPGDPHRPRGGLPAHVPEAVRPGPGPIGTRSCQELGSAAMDAVRTPDDRFDGLPGWPFEPRYVEHRRRRGRRRCASTTSTKGPADAPVVLLMHGEPSWAYLYRTRDPAAGRRRAPGASPPTSSASAAPTSPPSRATTPTSATSSGCARPCSTASTSATSPSSARTGAGSSACAWWPSTPTATPGWWSATPGCPPATGP